MASRILIALRLLLALACAATLLYCLAYPDSIIPRHPALGVEGDGITIDDLRPYLMWLPALALLLVSSGRHASRILFTAMGTVLVAALISWPLLDAHRPELLYSTFSFQSGMLACGLVQFCIFMAGVALLMGFISYFTPAPPEPTHEANLVDAADLAPEKGRTVQEIIANPIRANPQFLFGSPDMALIDRFRCFLGAVRRRRLLQGIITGFFALALIIWIFGYPRPDAEQALQRDLARMYETSPQGNTPYRATDTALHAAYRVMLYAQEHDTLTGLTREQAEKWLQLDKLDAAHRASLRDESPIELSSVDDLHDFRTRFLTITDGKRYAVLFIRTDAEDRIINVAEVQDAGWDAVADENRKYYGNAVRIHY